MDRSRHKLEDNVKIDVDGKGYEDRVWRDLVQGTLEGFGFCGNELSRSLRHIIIIINIIFLCNSYTHKIHF